MEIFLEEKSKTKENKMQLSKTNLRKIRKLG